MRTIKRLLTVVLATIFTATLFGCVDNNGNSEIKVVLPDGAPSVSFTKIINDGNIGNVETVYEIVSGADAVATAVANGSADVAVMPINLAAKVYNGGADIKLLSVNVPGTLFMVGKTPITDLNSLKNKIVYNIGRGGTPDITFRYFLEKNKVEYEESDTAIDGKVALQYVSSASELIVFLKTKKADYAIAGEPAISMINKNAETTSVLNFQEEWSKLNDGKSYTQAGVVVGKNVYENSELLTALKTQLSATPEWLDANKNSITTVLTPKGSTLKVEFTSQTIKDCNIKNLSALENKAAIENYLQVLLDFNPKTVGDKLPDENFYL